MKREMTILIAVAIVSAALAGCGSQGNEKSEEAVSAETADHVQSAKTPSTTTEAPEIEQLPETTTDNEKAILGEVTTAVKDAPKKFDANNISERNFTFWDRMGEDHIMGQTELAFYYAMNELSQGKITADMMISGEIDVDSTNLPEVYSVCDVARYQLELAAQNGYAKGSVFGLPYLFESREHFWNFAESDLGQQVIDEINDGGFACHVLTYIEEGARSYFSTKEHPINTADDLAGLKIRVQSSDIYNGMVQAVGASPTTMAWSEVYTGLSSGVIDAAENPYTGYNANMLYEVAPNFYEDEHIWGADILTISSEIWNSMNDDEKEMVQEAAAIASEYNKKHIEQVESDIKSKIEREGVTIVTPSADDKAKLVDLCKPMNKKFAGDYLDFIDQIKALK